MTTSLKKLARKMLISRLLSIKQTENRMVKTKIFQSRLMILKDQERGSGFILSLGAPIVK